MFFIFILNFIKADHVCPEGYGLDSQGNCKQCVVPSCSECYNDRWKCEKCKKGFGLGDGKCIYCNTNNCAECYNDFDKCEKCSEGYWLDNNVCQMCSKGCKECTGSTQCKTCSEQYLLKDGSCVGCIAHCADCSNGADTCVKCMEGYSLNSAGECTECTSSNCGECDGDNPSVCKKCMKGYGFDGSTCERCSDSYDCFECYNDHSKCELCRDGYTPSGSICTSCSLNGCSKCSRSNKTICVECKSNYRLNENGTCEKCADYYCSKCDKDVNFCEECESGHGVSLLDETSPMYGKCISHTDINPGCEEGNRTNATICLNCQESLYMDREEGSSTNGNCVICPLHCSNCTSKECVECDEGYGKNDNGECIKCQDPNCINCESDYTECSHCGEDDDGNDYMLDDGKCLSCEIENCARCSPSSNRYCNTCKDGYRWQNSTTCIECPKNCKECDSDNKCTTAIEGYIIISGDPIKCGDGCYKCDSSNLSLCTSCLIGYYKDTDNGEIECIKNDIYNCSEYYDTYHCQDCNDGYGVDATGHCTKCSDSLCLECSNDYTFCTFCDDGYTTDNRGKCVKKPNTQHCKEYDDYIHCSRCVAGYGKNNDRQCLRCGDENCVDCDSHYSYCIQCKNGYYFNEKGICTACQAENCKQCNETNPSECLDCNSGYRLNNDGKCIKCQASNCEICENHLGLCEICAKGHVFDLKKGSSTYRQCIPIKVSNCAEGNVFDLNICASCIDEDYWVLDESGQCVKRWSETKKKGLSTGAIVGIAVGSAVAVGLVVFLLVYFLACKKAGIANSSSDQ